MLFDTTTIQVALLGILVIAFFAEYIDSTLGMGYGTTLTPILLLMGYSPLQVVPAILLSEFITGLSAAFMHNKVNNVTFDFRRDTEHEIVKRLGVLGYIPRSIDSKVALTLALCSFVGAIIAVVVAINLPKFYLKLVIGIIVLSMGILILAKRNSDCSFSWNKIIGLGALASFNKGLSGGGYGPLVTSGQILCGVKSKSSIGITSFAESFTCLVGITAYFILGTTVDWSIAPYLVVGALMSVPLSAYSVKRINTNKFTLVIGIATVCLGLFTLWKTLA